MIGKKEEEAVLRVIRSGCLSGFQGNWSENFYGGTEVKALESEWSNYFNIKHSISCNSATSGLWAALAAIGINPGDEIIVSPYTMTCSASMPLHFKAIPVFADIESDFYCLDPIDIERKITNKTRAIIAVDLFGLCCDYDAINEIADRKGKEYGHKIYVLEDAAQAAGAKYKGKYAGTLGDIGVFSLNVHKPIQCGEGGVIATNDTDLANRLRLVINHAEAVTNDMHRQECLPDDLTFEYYSLVGMNLRMTELSAAIAREQLKKLEGIINALQEYAGCFPVKIRADCEHSFYRYAYIADDPKQDIELYNEWLAFNIKRHYIKPIYQMPLFQSLGYDQHCCPVCEQVDENIILAWLKEIK
jgi:perosamine synthetase